MPTKKTETDLAAAWPASPGKFHLAVQGTEIALRFTRLAPPPGLAHGDSLAADAVERLKGLEEFEQLRTLRENIAMILGQLDAARADLTADEQSDENALSTTTDLDAIAEADAGVASEYEVQCHERRLQRARELERRLEASLRTATARLASEISSEAMAEARRIQDHAIDALRGQADALDALLRAAALRRAASFPLTFDRLATAAGLPPSPREPAMMETGAV